MLARSAKFVCHATATLRTTPALKQLQTPCLSQLRSFSSFDENNKNSSNKFPTGGDVDDEEIRYDDMDEDEDDNPNIDAFGNVIEWNEEEWGPRADPDNWQGFTGDLDEVNEAGTPVWVESVRRISLIDDILQGKDKNTILRNRELKNAPVIRNIDIDEQGRSYGTGRRKTSSARVWIKKSDCGGKFTVNKKDITEYFARDADREELLAPFLALDNLGDYDVWCTVRGGGLSGQAGAIRHGISRALQNYNPQNRPALKKAGYLTRDPRMVERKKPGQPKARKKFQWVKR